MTAVLNVLKVAALVGVASVVAIASATTTSEIKTQADTKTMQAQEEGYTSGVSPRPRARPSRNLGSAR